MQATYYIDNDGRKEGPFDLVAVMRRIRSQKIGAHTKMYVETSEIAVLAKDIPEIASFFTQQDNPGIKKPAPSLLKVLRAGWHFTHEHNVMTVYAGVLMLVSFIFASMLTEAFGMVLGGAAAWLLYVLFQNCYLIFALRMYRGQPFSVDFVNQQLAPVMVRLVFASVILALAMVGGLILFVVPCLLVAGLYIFAPFVMLDRGEGIFGAMHASRVILRNHPGYLALILFLIILHLVCLLLIIPIPLTLPVFAAALAEIYEELSIA